MLQLNSSDLYLHQEAYQRWQALMGREGVVDGLEVALVNCHREVVWL
jgi:hypothetical protein